MNELTTIIHKTGRNGETEDILGEILTLVLAKDLGELENKKQNILQILQDVMKDVD